MIDLVAQVILALLALAIIGMATARLAAGRMLIYGGSLMLCAALLFAGLAGLAGPVERLVLPLGLPWIGTHLRLDALSGFFLVLIGLGGGGASLFALGYGRHEAHPGRVLPFYPAFLAGLSLVVVADDAFLFLFAWELMSLTSWALVMAHQAEAPHDSPEQRFQARRPTGRLRLPDHGDVQRDGLAAGLRSPGRRDRAAMPSMPCVRATPMRRSPPWCSCWR